VSTPAVPTVVISPVGLQGPRGNTILSGEGAPSSSVGVDGDYYADTTDYPTSLTLYGPKAGSWPGSGIVLTTGGGGVVSVNSQTGVVTITAAGLGALTSSNAASSVTAASSYGQSTVVGTDTTYAREDHSHGTPALTTTAPATTLGVGQAAALGSASLPARADHVHPMAAAGAPAASAVTSTQVTGVASTFAASDHVHAREGFGTVTAQTSFGASSGNGSASTVAHSDHTHGTPTLPTATTSVAGVVQLDGTASDIQALGAQAAGASGLAADARHVHPTTGLVTGVTAADTSVVVGGTSGAPTVRTATLDVIATQHPAAAAWSNNGQKITSVANGSASTDVAAYGQIPGAATTSTAGIVTIDGTAGDIAALGVQAAGSTGKVADAGHVHPTTGLVTGVTAADTSIVIGGTSGAPTVRTSTLDVIATQHPPAAAWSNNSQKITSLANGASAQDAAAFGQIPTVGSASNIAFVAATASAGSTGHYADAGHVHPYVGWLPSDNNLLYATGDPSSSGSTWVPTGATASGIVYLSKIRLAVAITMTNLWYGLSGAAGGAATTGNYFGVYDTTGTLQAVTSDLTSVYNGSTGAKEAAFVTPYSAAAGTYFIATLVNGTWAANTWSLKATGGGVTANAGLSAPSLKFSNLLTGQTTLPGTITLANQVTSAVAAGACSQWFGIS
jgi:hypothetical protein